MTGDRKIRINCEHRFTELETEKVNIKEDVKEIKQDIKDLHKVFYKEHPKGKYNNGNGKQYNKSTVIVFPPLTKKTSAGIGTVITIIFGVLEQLGVINIVG